MADTQRSLRVRFLRLLWALAMAVALALTSASGAKASLFACFQALAPLDEAKKAAEIAATAGACSTEATGDPMMAMTIAALTAAAAAKVFSTPDQCIAKINGPVGKLVASALLALPLPAEAKSQLQAFVDGNSFLSFDEIVAGVPGLDAVIAYIHCGCAVAGAPGAYAQIASDYAAHVKSCGNFASDAANTVLDAFASLGEDIHEALNGPSMKPGIQMEQTCVVQTLPDEIWTKTKIWTDPGFQCNVARCQPGHAVVKKYEGGQTLNKCVAKCPDPIETYQAGGKCYWTIDSKPVDGVCTQSTGIVHCCGDGQQVLKYGVCEPACSQGIQYWSTAAGACTNCQTGWYPVYSDANSSVGQCAECPKGQTYDFAAKTCVPLNCPPPLGHFDPQNPHACAYCKPGQVYSPATGKCGCSNGTIAQGDSCVCPKNASKIVSGASFTCACPVGATLDPAQSACVCPAGQHVVSKVVQGSVYFFCASLAPLTMTKPKTLPIVCPAGTHMLNGRCVPNVPPRSQFNPHATRAPPVATCPPGTHMLNGRCVANVPPPPTLYHPPTMVVPPTLFSPPTTVAPSTPLRCPAGTIPNRTRTGCIPAPVLPGPTLRVPH
jgi:hypothetical protein